MKIIGISGFKRAGKGETAAAVANLRVGNVRTLGFADKVKIYAARSLGFTTLTDEECIARMDEAKEDWCIEAYDVAGDAARLVEVVTGREYLQNVGNEGRRTFGEDFWIDQVLPNPITSGHRLVGQFMKNHYEGVDVLVFHDVRYPNEATRIRNLGGVVWEVVRPGLESDGHASETPLPRGLVDYQIRNVNNLSYLKTQTGLAILETL